MDRKSIAFNVAQLRVVKIEPLPAIPPCILPDAVVDFKTLDQKNEYKEFVRHSFIVQECIDRNHTCTRVSDFISNQDE